MDKETFRKFGYRFVDWVADYFEDVERYPVCSRLKPGDVKKSLPASPPLHPEPMDRVFQDFENFIKTRAIIFFFFDGREVGLMHACGHDIHTTMLLGVAHVLSELGSELAGTVLFVAQPAEEFGDGAAEMLKAGVFADIRPEAIFAFHVDDTAKVGIIKYAPEYAAANVDGFDLTIHSRGCHGSSPHDCVDPVVVGAQVVTALQVMVAREIDVHKDTVITVGSFHAGAARNVIPERAELKATVRSYGEDHRQVIKEKVTRLDFSQAVSAVFRTSCFSASRRSFSKQRLLSFCPSFVNCR